MARDFSAIRTQEEAKDALLGARVVGVTDQRQITFETALGERFRITIEPMPVTLQVGPNRIQMQGGVIWGWENSGG